MPEFSHMVQHWTETLTAAASGGLLYGVASYAARTFPVPSNPIAKWLLGVVQFALANPDKAGPTRGSGDGGAQ